MSDNTPSDWNLKMLVEQWHAHLRSLIDDKKTELPFERLCFQSQTDPRYAEILSGWSSMDAAARADAWQTLVSLADAARDEMLPICVRCGSCCTAGSPALTADDLELLGEEGIAWSHLVTLRRGEPAHSLITGEAFLLPEERVKLREKPGGKVCLLYDEAHKSCAVHEHKPSQCRAQACWEPELANQQRVQPPLTRRDIFQGMAVLLEVIDRHEARCDFAKFTAAFDTLRQTKGENIDQILDMLAFDEHVREFAVKEMGVPEDGLELVFGRGLTDRLRLFGFQAVSDADGSRVLRPLTDNA